MELVKYMEEFDFQHLHITDGEMFLLFDMLVDAPEVYSEHKFDVRKTHRRCLATLKPNAELKGQRPSKVTMHLKEKLKKLLTQLKVVDIIWELADDDEMGSLFVNPINLMRKNDYVKLVIEWRISLTSFGPWNQFKCLWLVWLANSFVLMIYLLLMIESVEPRNILVSSLKG